MSDDAPAARGSVLEILATMGRLGCIAFGGPVAHLAWFQRELVEKRRWIGADEFTDLIAFCQFLPGPASSQVGMCLGLRRGGLPGMFAAWFAFTMPSVLFSTGTTPYSALPASTSRKISSIAASECAVTERPKCLYTAAWV